MSAWAWTHQCGSPLAPFADGFRMELERLGYSHDSVVVHVVVMGQVSRWLSASGLEAEDLTWAGVDGFLTSRRARGQKRMPTLVPLMKYLSAKGVISPPAPLLPTPLETLLERYRLHLVRDRGLASSTTSVLVHVAGTFLSGRVAASGSDTGVEGITGAEVQAFLLGECRRVSVGSAKNRVTQIRSLLRFLFLSGLIGADLAAAVPPVASWRDTVLPTTMATSDVYALVGSCDRSKPGGMRDYAILMLLARLGLRSCEVAWLLLDDIDWRAGEIGIHGKGGDYDRLPLPADVGEALAQYLERGRPSSTYRAVFLTRTAPLRAIRPSVTGNVVRGACRRCGLEPVNPHRLRHALAGEMLAQGVALTDIGQILRHRDLAVTSVYAKVDRAALRTVAQEWLGVGR